MLLALQKRRTTTDTDGKNRKRRRLELPSLTRTIARQPEMSDKAKLAYDDFIERKVCSQVTFSEMSSDLLALRELVDISDRSLYAWTSTDDNGHGGRWMLLDEYGCMECSLLDQLVMTVPAEDPLMGTVADLTAAEHRGLYLLEVELGMPAALVGMVGEYVNPVYHEPLEAGGYEYKCWGLSVHKHMYEHMSLPPLHVPGLGRCEPWMEVSEMWDRLHRHYGITYFHDRSAYEKDIPIIRESKDRYWKKVEEEVNRRLLGFFQRVRVLLAEQ